MTEHDIDIVGLGIAGIGHRGAGFEAESREVLLRDEIDDACDRIRAVNGGRAPRDDLDPIDQELRNQIQIDGIADAGRSDTTPVQQYQGTTGAQAAQVDDGGADAGVTVIVVGRPTGLGQHLWQLVERFLERGVSAEMDLLGTNRHERARRHEVAALDARARDDDLVDHLVGERCIIFGFFDGRTALECHAGQGGCNQEKTPGPQ